jgi:hypothetical protein
MIAGSAAGRPEHRVARIHAAVTLASSAKSII